MLATRVPAFVVTCIVAGKFFAELVTIMCVYGVVEEINRLILVSILVELSTSVWMVATVKGLGLLTILVLVLGIVVELSMTVRGKGNVKDEELLALTVVGILTEIDLPVFCELGVKQVVETKERKGNNLQTQNLICTQLLHAYRGHSPVTLVESFTLPTLSPNSS